MTSVLRAPLYFDGGTGRCYATLFSLRDPRATPAGEGGPTACLFVPPFGEEMNKSRRSVALLGEALAAQGRWTLVPDLGGTGDSGGDFVDARWELWCADLQAAASLLRDLGAQSVSIVALRFGALLAVAVLQSLALPVDRLVLWQPVISGSQYLTQFLRLRVAAGLTEGGGATVRKIRDELERAGSVEVGGYELSLPLARAMEDARLDLPPSPTPLPIHWLDVASDPERPLPGPAQSLIDSWRSAGLPVAVERVRGDAFWATQEITEASELVAATARLLAPSSAVIGRTAGADRG